MSIYDTSTPEGNGDQKLAITPTIAADIRKGLGADAAPIEKDVPGILMAWTDKDERPFLTVQANGTVVGKFLNLNEDTGGGGEEPPDNELIEAIATEIEDARGTAATLDGRLRRTITKDGLLDRHRWGEWTLRSFGIKRVLLEADSPSGKLSIALFGDSWTHQATRFPQPFARKLKTSMPDGGGGFFGFGYFSDGGAVNGCSDGAIMTGSKDPTNWTRIATGADAVYALDASHIQSSIAGAWVSVSIQQAQDACRIHFRQTPGGGSFRYQVNSGSWITVDTDGAESYGLETVVIPNAACTVRIEVIEGLVTLNGLDAQKTTGVCVHKLAHSGGRLSHYVTNIVPAYFHSGIAALNLDVAVIMFATNEQGGSVAPEVYAANLLTLIQRIRSACPLCDIVIVSPARNGREGLTYSMEDYRDAAYDLAATLGVGFLDLIKVFGDFEEYKYSTDGSTRNLFAADLIHPDPPRGGRVITDAVYRLFHSL